MGADSPLPLEPSARFRRAQLRVLFATMACYLFYYTGRQTFGFAIPGIESELGISKTHLGWISTALLWTYGIGQAINGNLGDKFGGRVMMSTGAVLSCALNWALSFSRGFYDLLVIWGLNGYAQSMGWAPGSRVLSNWWSRAEHGRVYGAYVFAAGMSSVLAFAIPGVILWLQLDWRWIFRLPVLLLLIGGIAYFILVRDLPSDEGFPPVEDETAAPDTPTIMDDEREGVLARYAIVLSNWRFLLASVAIGFQSAARYGLLIWVPVHLLGDDWTQDKYGKWASLALPLGMASGALASGWLSDRLLGGNRSRLISVFLALAAAVSLTMYNASDNLVRIVPLLFLGGFFVYGSQAAFWPLCPELLGARRAGTGTGVMDAFAYLFAGLGEPFIGWVIETNDGRTELVFVVVAASCLSSAILAIGVRR